MKSEQLGLALDRIGESNDHDKDLDLEDGFEEDVEPEYPEELYSPSFQKLRQFFF